ncbi:hypothetical protein D3C85_121020 [compost metagenome]
MFEEQVGDLEELFVRERGPVTLEAFVPVLERSRYAHTFMLKQLSPHFRLLIESPQVRSERKGRVHPQTFKDLNDVPVVLRRHHQRVTTIYDDGRGFREAVEEAFDVHQFHNVFGFF